MSGEEGVQMSMQMMTTASQTGVKIITQLAGTGATLIWQGVRATQKFATQAVQNQLNSGNMNLKRLQTQTGGDLHQQEIINPDRLKDLKTDLKKRGLNFSIENAADGNTYLHFSGKDIDTISHALTQVMNENTKPSLNQDTQGQNIKPDNAPTLNSLNPTGTVFANYDPHERATAPLGPNMTTLAHTQNVPATEMVTIYRGIPNGVTDTIAPGDYITTNKQLAQDYAGTGTIVESTVPAGDILDDLTEPGGEEYLYRPGAIEQIHTQSLNKPETQPDRASTRTLGQKDIKAALQNKVEARAEAAKNINPKPTMKPRRQR